MTYSRTNKLLIIFVFSSAVFPDVQGALLDRNKRNVEQTVRLEPYVNEPEAACIFMKIEEGRYTYRSDGRHDICGLYIVSDPDTVIEFEFDYFDVTCTGNSQLDVVDGWELNSQIFPSPDDSLLSLRDRVSTYCGRRKPRRPNVTSQNVGLIRFKIGESDEGFDVVVRFLKNPKPCNMLLTEPSGVYMISNYGKRMNCSIAIMFPVTFDVVGTGKDIGLCQPHLTYSQNALIEISKKYMTDLLYRSYGFLNKIAEHGDCLEFRGGSGLDPLQMSMVPFTASNKVKIACKNSVLRLVSSGLQTNAVTVNVEMLLDFASPDLVCPNLLKSLGF